MAAVAAVAAVLGVAGGSRGAERARVRIITHNLTARYPLGGKAGRRGIGRAEQPRDEPRRKAGGCAEGGSLSVGTRALLLLPYPLVSLPMSLF